MGKNQYRQSGAKIMGHFKFMFNLTCTGLPPAPPTTNVDEIEVIFFFPAILTTLYWGKGVIYTVVPIIFAPDCSAFLKKYGFEACDDASRFALRVEY